MNALRRIGAALAGAHDTAAGCFGCAHFANDPAAMAAALPGIETLSSIHASVRAQDGLCNRHGVLLNGHRRCDDFHTRGGFAP